MNEITSEKYSYQPVAKNSLEGKLLEFLQTSTEILSGQKNARFKIEYGGDYLKGNWDEKSQELSMQFAADSNEDGYRFECIDLNYHKITQDESTVRFESKITSYLENETYWRLLRVSDFLCTAKKRCLDISIT